MSRPARMDLEFSDCLSGQSDILADCDDMSKQVTKKPIGFGCPASKVSGLFRVYLKQILTGDICAAPLCMANLTPPVPFELQDATTFSPARAQESPQQHFPSSTHSVSAVQSILRRS